MQILQKKPKKQQNPTSEKILKNLTKAAGKQKHREAEKQKLLLTLLLLSLFS